ncbi:MAG: hypothetical protein PHV20_12515 [Bacteroidales bacterium]|nr:hypothetical protein [Bacteroidales bacterium]
MERVIKLFTASIFLFFICNTIDAQSNCECSLCRVPCNAPLSAHKNTKCPAYIAAHKSSTPSTSPSKSSNNNSLGNLNTLMNAVSGSSKDATPKAPEYKREEPQYDPMDAALKSTNQRVRKVEDPQTVDLSGLKEPYSAKVDITELKEVDSKKDTEEKCKAAFEYKQNRLIALNNLLNNRQNIVSQQEKSLANAKTDFENWKNERMKIIKDQLGSYFKDIVNEKLESLNEQPSYESSEKVQIIDSEDSSGENSESNLVNFCNYFVAGLNKTSKVIDAIPAVKAAVDKSPAKWLKKAVDDGPKLIDALALVYIQNEINDHNKDLLKENQNMFLLNAKIESWMNEKAELEACKDDDCNCVRAIMQKRRPDLRDSPN